MKKIIAKLLEIKSKVQVWGITGIKNYLLRELHNCHNRKTLKQLIHQSSVQFPKQGITIIADLTTQVSLSKVMRDFIFLLKAANIPFQTYDLSRHCQIPQEDAENIITPPSEFDIRKYDHIVMMYQAPLDKRLFTDIKFARIAFYESEYGIDEVSPYLKESGDAIIAMSDFNYSYFKRVFHSQKVYKITYPLNMPAFQPSTHTQTIRQQLGLADNDFIVFFNFDFGSYYRKNIPDTIDAFARAFSGYQNVKLIFKTKNAKENPRQVAEMESCVDKFGIRNQFIFLTKYLSRADLLALSSEINVYLSLHHAEGFGLGMAEAMIFAKPVVATDWSANTEFCLRETSWPIPVTMTPILPHEYMIAMREWAKPDVAAAARALREIYNDYEKACKRAKKGQLYIRSHFSIENFKRDIEYFLQDV